MGIGLLRAGFQSQDARGALGAPAAGPCSPIKQRDAASTPQRNNGGGGQSWEAPLSGEHAVRAEPE